MPIFFDKLLARIDSAVGASKLGTGLYLMYVALFYTILTLTALTLAKNPNDKNMSTSKSDRVTKYMLITSALFLAVGLVTSAGAYHLNAIDIAGTFLTVATLIYVAATGRLAYPQLLLISITMYIFTRGSIHYITGVEEGETASDMINIKLNGYFRWSIHGVHYDLAPMDAILKVILVNIAGSDVFDPIAASLLYSLHGLAFMLIVASLVKQSAPPERGIQLIALMPLLFTAYPYSTLVGLSIPPAPLSQSMGIVTLALLIRGVTSGSDWGDYKILFITIPLVVYVILIHPSSLGFLLTMMALSIAAAKTSGTKRRLPLYVSVIALVIYFAKVAYTAFAAGFVTNIELLRDYIMNAFAERKIELTTRNVGYSSAPRISLTGFGLFPAIVASYTLWLLARHRKKIFSNAIDLFYLGAVAVYFTFFTAAYLTALGGVSQSRMLFNAVEPYMELALLTNIMSNLRELGTRRFKMLTLFIAVASIFTLITPNAMPLNYTIPMAKPATSNDHLISYMYMGMVSRETFTEFYNSYGERGRLVAVQERGEATYGLGSTMSVVYYYIAPRAVDAKSYWDPRIMAIFAMPKDVDNWIVDRVFDAWVYAFYIYLK